MRLPLRCCLFRKEWEERCPHPWLSLWHFNIRREGDAPVWKSSSDGIHWDRSFATWRSRQTICPHGCETSKSFLELLVANPWLGSCVLSPFGTLIWTLISFGNMISVVTIINIRNWKKITTSGHWSIVWCSVGRAWDIASFFVSVRTISTRGCGKY